MSDDVDAKYPGLKLTVIIRDDSPWIHMQHSPQLRSVSIMLNEYQRKQLMLACTGKIGGRLIFEKIDRCFIED